MTKFFLFAAMFAFAIFTSCSNSEIGDEVLPTTTDVELTNTNEDLEEGIVEFTIDNQDRQVLEKEALLLTNSSTNAVSYLWDFGNGHTSTEANPAYTYDMHGYFTVNLTITDKYDNTQEVSHDVEVLCLFGGGNHGSF